MKLSLISIVLLLITDGLFCQNNFTNNPSIDLAIAPSFFSSPEIGVGKVSFCPTNLYLNWNFNILNRISFSLGLNYLNKKSTEDYSIHGEYGYSGPVSLSHNLNSFSLPLKVNYHLTKPKSNFKVYFRVDFVNTFKIRKSDHSPGINGEYFFTKSNGYSSAIGFGFGMSYPISENISLIFEPQRRFFISGFLPQYDFIDAQFGLKFSLKRIPSNKGERE